MKRPELLQPTFDALADGCTGLRQLGRRLEAAPSTLQTHAERAGRHALLFLAQHAPPAPPAEPLVIDGFESFAYSQYHPLHINVAVGAESQFLYAFTGAELRRKGRMTATQKARRAVLEREQGCPPRDAIERSVEALLHPLAPAGSTLRIRSDEHRAYPRAFRRMQGVSVHHERTSSKAARTPRNPLFPVNRLDLLARHGGANHKRETIAFSKRFGAVLERFAVFAVWLNFCKSRSEKRRDATPAQVLGLTPKKLSSADVLQTRLFPSQIALSPEAQRVYQRAIPTRALPQRPPLPRRYAA